MGSVFWSIAWNSSGDFLQWRKEIDAHVHPLSVVVGEVFLDDVPVGRKILRDVIKTFLLDGPVESLDMRVVVCLPHP